MIRLSISRVRPGKEQELRDWLEQLNQRKAEVRETFEQESVRHEQAYLVPTAEGTMLVYAMEAEDFEKGRHAYQNSTLPIDLEHKRIMKETVGDKIPVELLYDCAVEC